MGSLFGGGRAPLLVFIVLSSVSCASTFSAGQMPLELMPVPCVEKTETAISLSGNVSQDTVNTDNWGYFGQAGVLHTVLIPHLDNTRWVLGGGGSAWAGQALLSGNTGIISEAPSVPEGNYSGGLLPAQPFFWGASLQGTVGYRLSNPWMNTRILLNAALSWEAGDYLPLRNELDKILVTRDYSGATPKKPYKNMSVLPISGSASLEIAWDRPLGDTLRLLFGFDIGTTICPGTDLPFYPISGCQLQLRYKKLSYVLAYRFLFLASHDLKLGVVLSL